MGPEHLSNVARHAMPNLAIACQWRLHHGKLTCFRKLQVKLPVFATLRGSGPQRWIIPSCLQNRSGRHQRATRVSNEISSAQLRQYPAFMGRSDNLADAAFSIDGGIPGVHQARTRPTLTCKRKLALDLVRLPKIIGIDRSDKISGRLFQCQVSCLGNATICLREKLNSCILSQMLFHQVAGVIGRAIIYDDDFKVSMCLAANAKKSLLYSCTRIVSWYNDTD